MAKIVDDYIDFFLQLTSFFHGNTIYFGSIYTRYRMCINETSSRSIWIIWIDARDIRVTFTRRGACDILPAAFFGARLSIPAHLSIPFR